MRRGLPRVARSKQHQPERHTLRFESWAGTSAPHKRSVTHGSHGGNVTTYRIEWWNGWTNRLRVSTVKVADKPKDWRKVIRDKHHMVSVLDIHILSIKEK